MRKMSMKKAEYEKNEYEKSMKNPEYHTLIF